MSSDPSHSSHRRRHRRKYAPTGRRAGAAERLKRRRKGRYLLADGSRPHSKRPPNIYNRIAWIVFAAAIAIGVVLIIKAPKHLTPKRPVEPLARGSNSQIITEEDKAIFRQVTEALDANDADRAEPLILELNKHVPNLEGLHFRRAQLAYMREREKEALELAGESIAREEELYLSHYLIGVIHAKQQDYEKATHSFAKGHKLAQWNPTLLQNWGAALRRLKRYSEAIDKYERAQALDSNMQLFTLKIYLIYIEQGDDARTREYVTDMLRWTPDSPIGLLLQAALHLKDGKYNAAAESLTKVKANLEPAAMASLMEDPFYSQYSDIPELADVTKPQEEEVDESSPPVTRPDLDMTLDIPEPSQATP